MCKGEGPSTFTSGKGKVSNVSGLVHGLVLELELRDGNYWALRTYLQLAYQQGVLKRSSSREEFGTIIGLDAPQWPEGLQAPALRSYALTTRRVV